MNRLAYRLWQRITDWLTREETAQGLRLCDYARLCDGLRPGDVLLVEGRSRVSLVIKLITQSPWTHAALYIGRPRDIRDRDLRALVASNVHADRDEPLIVEALLGQGTRIAPLAKYRGENVRVCRPAGLSRADARHVIGYAVRRLGSDYDVRQLLDLARFFFPWTILPRCWRSSLFEHNAGGPTRTVCSCLIAEAFDAVEFPIMPFIERGADGTARLFRRNPRLFTPKDFDDSPYFLILKFPLLGLARVGAYRQLPWAADAPVYSDRDRRRSADLAHAWPLPTPLPALARDPPAGTLLPSADTAAEADERCPA